MIIPIRLESEDSHKDESVNSPIVTFPPDDPTTEGARDTVKETRRSPVPKEAKLGDILLPVLSKYFRLRDSKRRDLRTLLAKEHPLQIESFKKDHDKYELQLDVQKFKPEELSIKITDDWISILGKHEEQPDKHTYRKQEFLRRYSLPCEVKAVDITCELSSDGHLVISAPKQNQPRINITDVTVPIVQTDAIKII